MESDKGLKLAIVRHLIAKVETINPAAELSGHEGLWLDVLDGLNGVGALAALSEQLKTNRQLREALEGFIPFTRLKSAQPEENFAALVGSEVAEIECSGVLASDQPALELQSQEESLTQVGRWKWMLLLVLYALEFAILYGLEAAFWNIIRQLGGVSYNDPKRIGTEMAAAIGVAIQFPEFQRLLRHVLDRAKLAPVFNGEVNIIIEHAEMISTGFLGGLSIDAGVHAAIALAGDDPGLVRYWLFLGYFGAFFVAGFLNGIGQLCLGRKLAMGPPGEPYPDDAKRALVVFGNHYVNKDVLLYERLLHFFNWGLYNFYGERFGEGEPALGGSLWLFVALFKISFFWAGKLRERLLE